MSLSEMVAAVDRRSGAIRRWKEEGTNCYRLFHGAVEGEAGTTVDRYGPLALVQTWRRALAPGELEAVLAVVIERIPDVRGAVWKDRAGGTIGGRAGDVPDLPRGSELGLSFDVRPEHPGSDPLLFLDLRAGRRRLRSSVQGKSVLNLFAYTGACGVVAAAGGASEVWNVDFSDSHLDIAEENARWNGFTAVVRRVREDAFVVTRQLAGLPVNARPRRRFERFAPREFDVVVVDPPTWATSPFGTVDLVRDYQSTFKPALLSCKTGGAMLVTNHAAAVDAAAWHAVLHRAAAKAGRPIRSLESLLPEEDFPSPDGRSPLKMAWLEV